MNGGRRWLWLVLGMLLGGGTCWYFAHQPRVWAGSNDRYDDYVLCTGSVASSLKAPTDGVWLLDYRAGKLLGTVIDRNAGKIVGWAELDLVTEFNLPPRQNVHFLMTTGQIAQGQSALYLAETTSGKFAVYSMGVRTDGKTNVYIRRHDLAMFRQTPPVKP